MTTIESVTPIMLVRPMTSTARHSDIISTQYPINIGYLVAYLKKHEIKCSVRDFEVEPYSDENFLDSISSKKPLLVGFSCMTPHVAYAAKMAKLLKEHFPGIMTVIGGVHASAIPKQTLEEFPQFDFVIFGEGEIALLEMCRNLKNNQEIKKIRGLAFRQNERIQVNQAMPFIENMDSIPFPERKILDMEYYKRSHVSRGFSRQVTNIAEIMCSRGCPYSCIFCASKVVHSRVVRFRSSENIIAEMEMLIKSHGVKHFSFLDDTFTIKKDILEPVCKFMGLNKVTFDCFTRVNDLDEQKIALMVAGGCKKISFGIESGSARILKLLKKGITLDQIDNAFRIARKAKLPIIEATFMIGCHPEETIEDIDLTRKLIYRLKPDILGLFIATPYPGTELNTILKASGLLLKEEWDKFRLFLDAPTWESGKVPMKQLQRILKETVYGYYLSPSYVMSSLSKIRNLKQLRYLAQTGLALIKTKFNKHRF